MIGALLGLLPASIARSKGYGFGTWWLYGAALFLVALPHALILKLNQEGIEARQLDEGMKKCPSCAEMVQGEAAKCRFCGHEWVPIVASWTVVREKPNGGPGAPPKPAPTEDPLALEPGPEDTSKDRTDLG